LDTKIEKEYILQHKLCMNEPAQNYMTMRASAMAVFLFPDLE